MPQVTTIQISDLNDHLLNWAIKIALGLPRIDMSVFDQTSHADLCIIAENHDIAFDSDTWTIEDFRDAFNKANDTVHQYTNDVEAISRLINKEYISVTIGDRNPQKIPTVQNWKARSLLDEINGNDNFLYGPTKDIAALRCFVASKLGFAIEVPNALLSASSHSAVSSPKPKF